MPDDLASDDALIEAAHKAVDALGIGFMRPELCHALHGAITALGKRFYQLREERQAAEDALAHAQSLLAPVVSGVLELDSFLRHGWMSSRHPRVGR